MCVCVSVCLSVCLSAVKTHAFLFSRSMMQADTWGDSIVLDILSLEWQAKLFVVICHDDYTVTEQKFRVLDPATEPLDNGDIVLLYNGSSHYNACSKSLHSCSYYFIRAIPVGNDTKVGRFLNTKKLITLPGFNPHVFATDPDPNIDIPTLSKSIVCYIRAA